MRKAKFVVEYTLLLGATLASAAWSQNAAAPPANNAGMLKAEQGEKMSAPTSQEFVTKATEANIAEIKVSQLALSKTQRSDVRTFATKMVADHQKANAELAPLAQAKSLKVPDDADLKHRASMKMLETKSGDSFDNSYIEAMSKDHKAALALFQAASTSAKVDPELQAFARKTLPALQEHHTLVSQLMSAKDAATAKQ